MDRLRELFSSLGCSDVETFIASGNMIFGSGEQDAQALEGEIERHLHQALGYEVATFLRTFVELGAVANYEAFPAAEIAGNHCYILFLPAPPDGTARKALDALQNPDVDVRVHQREVYWLLRNGIGELGLMGPSLDRAAGTPATMRNATTVRKLAAKYPAGP